ncbi:MAG: hypothetical protein FJX80_09890 [Bacteroidetes bacterium]|nr:hypothetical protein [Bacteroidota bacterium]
MVASDDKADWDQKNKAMNYPIFMKNEILDILEPGWTLKSCDSIDNLPCFTKRKLGLSYFLQPFLARTLHGFEHFETKKWNTFFPKICQFNVEKLPASLPENWETKELKFQCMSLEAPLEEIEKKFSENVVRIGKKLHSYSLETITDLSYYFEFIRKHNSNFTQMKSELFSKFKNLIIYFDSCGQGEILGIKDDNGKFVAMSYFVFDKSSVIDFKGAVTKEGKKRGAMVLLHLRAISKFHGFFKLYDFYGANSDGRAHFNRKFGGHNVIYYQLTRIDYPKPLKYLIRKLWSI